MNANSAPFDHEPCDRMVPVAARIVGAVRDDDAGYLLDLIAEAETVGGRQWQLALVVTLAAMVPDTATPGRLLGWLGAA